MRPDDSAGHRDLSAATDFSTNVLIRSDNVENVGSYLAEQIRAMTGARCVVIVQNRTTAGVVAHHIVGVDPPARRPWAEAPTAGRLYEVIDRVPYARFWRREEPSEVADLIQREDVGLSITVPLSVGNSRVGAVLLVGIAEEQAPSMRDLVSLISVIATVALRDSSTSTPREGASRGSARELRDLNKQLQTELAERVAAETLLNGQTRVMELVARNAPLEETLTTLVSIIEEQVPGMLGSILLLDSEGVHLRHGGAPSLPAEYVAAIDGVAIGPSVGSCGTAAHSKHEVIVADIATDPLWADYKAAALPAGLRACWSTPIFDEQHRVLGTFAMYYHQPALPQPYHRRLIEVTTRTAAIAIGRRRAEDAMRESETEYRELLQRIHAGVVVHGPDTRILASNQLARDLLGLTEEQMLGKMAIDPAWQFFGEDGNVMSVDEYPVNRVLGTARPLRDASVRVHRPTTGDDIWVLASADPVMDGQHEIKQVIVTFVDITARRRAEDQVLRLNVQRRDDALEASRLKSEFLASMSHEIRTPMTGVIGLTDLLLGTDLDETQRRYAHGVDAAGKALLAIISDVLDISKIESGGITLVRVEFAVPELVEEVVDLLGEKARAKGIGLASYYSPQLPDVLIGDPVRLHQILLNLVDNAVKFTGHGGVSVFVTPADGPGLDSSTVDVRIDVVDTGVGVSADDLGRIFARFAQATPSPVRPAGGTGLGLAISKQLVDLMGGDIGARSDIGEGSTFWCTIPMERPATSAPAAFRLDVAGRRALLVEPDAVIRSVLDRYLTDWGMQVDTVDSARQAVDLLRATPAAAPIDVAIVERFLPDGDGLDVARSYAETTETPIVILAVPAGDEVPVAGNVRAVLHRPVHRNHLRDSVVRVFAEPVTPPAPAQPSTPAAGQGRVLVVEDNEVNQMVAVGMLNRYGYSADVATDGAKAVEKTATEHYQLILMDVLMPGIDGYQATREIRRREGDTEHTPIVAMTAITQPDDRDQCLNAGMDDYIAKPFTPADLTAVLARWLPPSDRPSHSADNSTP